MLLFFIRRVDIILYIRQEHTFFSLKNICLINFHSVNCSHIDFIKLFFLNNAWSHILYSVVLKHNKSFLKHEYSESIAIFRKSIFKYEIISFSDLVWTWYHIVLILLKLSSLNLIFSSFRLDKFFLHILNLWKYKRI